MEEIRFNQPVAEPKPTETVLTGESRKKWPDFVKILIPILAVIVFVAGFYAKNLISKKGSAIDIEVSPYSAVFLANGQVYFGKMVSKNDSEFVLSDVFYLQISGDAATTQAQLSQPKFSLIKLGNELHGPTNELYINTSQILFYEKLRNDSKVVESIKNYKQ